MNRPNRNGISRRQFARRAALLSASAAVVPAAGALAEALPALPTQDAATQHPNLPPPSQAEADARLQLILAQYGNRFSDDEKTFLQKINGMTQQSLDRVRAYPLDNGDSPALYLKPLVEREKKKSNAPAAIPAKNS